MMKTKIRALALLLVIIHVLSLIACGSSQPAGSSESKIPVTPPDSPGENGTDQNDPGVNKVEKDTSTITKPDGYPIVYASTSYVRTEEAATALAATMSDVLKTKYSPVIDVTTESSDAEILIGATNRPESAEALALVTNDDSFVIKTIGKKTVINAKNDGALVVAINYFRKLTLEEGFDINKAIEYVSEPIRKVTVANGGKSSFAIVHLSGLRYSGGTEDKADLEVQLSRELEDEFRSTYFTVAPIKADSVTNTLEIIVGDSSRKETADFKASLAPNEYGFEVMGDKIVIAGTSSIGTVLAKELFVEALHSFDETKNGLPVAILYDGLRITKRNTKLNTDIPEYEGGVYGGAYDGADNALTLIYKETNAADFAAYCGKLEAEGYKLWQRTYMENNVHATYTHETRGMIHTYYTDSQKSVRIVSYFAGDYNLPTNKEPVEYEKITEPSVTGYGRSNGMCFVITLADGSFIVVDSGTTDTTDRFYKLLKDLNKRPDGKIHIRAWYLTHEHYDHYRMFSNFMKKYGKDIILDEFWCNPVTSEFTHYSDNRDVMWVESYEEYKQYVNGDFKWINLHTGMKFYVANMKFEVIYTDEDIFPQRSNSFNDMILAMKMTDMISGQTMLWLGDLAEYGCRTLAGNYDTYLKCNVLQVAHHGKSVALPLYKKVLPSVALWPTFESHAKDADSVNGGIYAETNKFLRENVSIHFYHDNIYTLNFPILSKDNVKIWPK